MAGSASTGFVVAAGGLVITYDLLVGPWNPPQEIKRGLATVVAAIVSYGVDRVIPGLGTGLAVILALTAAVKVGPPLLTKVFPSGSSSS